MAVERVYDIKGDMGAVTGGVARRIKVGNAGMVEIYSGGQGNCCKSHISGTG